MLKLFKFTAILEGISSILLFLVAVPLKYLFANVQYMRPIGMAHGVLFAIFVAFVIYFAVVQKWKLNKTAIFLIASVIPFATFYIERKYLRNA
jgi:integral membrane protein